MLSRNWPLNATYRGRTVLSAIEAALVSAYKKDSIMTGQDISVQLDPATGDVAVYILKTVVEGDRGTHSSTS